MSYTPPPPPPGEGPEGQPGPPQDPYGSQPGYGQEPGQFSGGPGYGPPPTGGYGSGYGGGGYGQPKTNQKALWSLILGILGLVCCGIFTAIPALILGNGAKKQIAASGGTETGAGMAQAGVILGIIAIALSVLGLVLFAAGVFAMPETSTSP